MTVGKSGELNLTCGGAVRVAVTALWEEWTDSSVIAVTGLRFAAKQAGTYTLSGTIAVDGAVPGRLTDCAVTVTEDGGAVMLSGDFPYISAPISYDTRDSAALTVQLTGQGFYASGSETIPLTMQPMASAVAASGQLIGSPVHIVIGAVEEGAVHTLRYRFGELSGVIGTELQGGGQYWDISIDLCEAIPDSGSGACVIACDTYIDGSYVGTEECTVTLVVPVSVGLELTDGWVTLEPAETEDLDCFVQGFSRVRAVFDASKVDLSYAFGAVPVSYDMTVGGVRYADCSVVLRSNGTIPVVCGVTDSRGRRYEETAEITVLPYTPPALGDVTVFRCGSDGIAHERGDSLSVSGGYGVSGLNGQNHGTLTARLRTVGGAWSEAVILPDAEAHVLWQGGIDPNNSYEVLIRVTDVLGQSSGITVTMPCTNVFFHGRKEGRGAAFGKQAEEDDVLEVAWSLKTKGDLVVEGTAVIGGKALWEHIYPVGSVCACAADADPAAIFGGTWTEAGDGICQWVRTE